MALFISFVFSYIAANIVIFFLLGAGGAIFGVNRDKKDK